MSQASKNHGIRPWNPPSVGVETEFTYNLQKALDYNLDVGGFSFVLTPLVHCDYRPSVAQSLPDVVAMRLLPYGSSDFSVNPEEWHKHIIGKISSWIDLDSENESLRVDSEASLKQEIYWASYLSLQGCLLPTPKGTSCVNYARCVKQILQGLESNMELWLRIPFGMADDGCTASSPTWVHSWKIWNSFRQLCDHHSQLRVAVDIYRPLPPGNSYKRWYGEPVVAAIIDSEIFYTNNRARSYKNTKCLSTRHRKLISDLIDHSIQIIISDIQVQPNKTSEDTKGLDSAADKIAHPLRPCLDHIGYLCEQMNPLDEPQSFEGYFTATLASKYSLSLVLYFPLVIPDLDLSSFPFPILPLRLTFKRLLSVSYSDPPSLSTSLDVVVDVGGPAAEKKGVEPTKIYSEALVCDKYEKDHKKYSQYESAIRQALLDRFPKQKASKIPAVLIIAGAGRGPLVRASLNAAKKTGRVLRIYALENNPNVAMALKELIESEAWENIVTVITCNARSWVAPVKADILVSDLLGSFGDNELSPECIDGLQRFLKKDGISIPSSYTSFLQPLTASKLYNNIKKLKDILYFDTPYEVKIHKVYRIAPTQQVFSFHHPKCLDKESNQRYKKLHFVIPDDLGSAMVHGFAGYFDATLYKDVHLGIEPSTATPTVFTWFPMFFPLKTPICVDGGSTLEVHFWRCCDSTKIWYEWCITSPFTSQIHNCNGRSYRVNL
ncbi:protein arginine N-methyltransferase 1.5-like [Abrus precatorius]|uniref:Protein arginine N-methyltransferase n=1 Tax=Abrus precatorius TaxID=3816 RepID=A0A8B8JN20_ABRPR|nr:protein arginine N-methyltransferase 1.5-like [Abrus precatorius]